MTKRRFVRTCLVPILVLLAMACCCQTAAAQRTLLTIETPSRYVDTSHIKLNGPPEPTLRARVLLPDGYDPSQRYPVLYLLHGAGDNYAAWADPAKGDALDIAKEVQAIIVMPEGGVGFFTDWWNGGRRGDPGWESYYLRELIPYIQHHFSIRPGRRWHAIAGLSMGGMGATYLASQLPGYFGTAATFSGFIQHQRPEAETLLGPVAGVNYQDIWGPGDGFYASGHNPTRLTSNLRYTRTFVAVGNGVNDPTIDAAPFDIAAGAPIEVELHMQADQFVPAARAAGVDVTYIRENGVHSWPYWRIHLSQSIRWGLFQPVAEHPLNWTYTTVATQGRMWDLRYEFAAPPDTLITFTRAGGRLSASGTGSVTLRTTTGCQLRETLPFSARLPAGRCH